MKPTTPVTPVTAPQPGPPSPPEPRKSRIARKRLLAAIPLVALLCVALFGPAVLPFLGLDPLRPDIAMALAPPSAQHWFGTDVIGRDVFARVVLAARLDLFMAVGAVLLAAVPGIAIGSVSGFMGGRADRVLQRIVDVAMAFPLFVVALALAAVMGNSVASVVLATALINLPFYIRLSRAEVAVRRSARYVAAARLAGWRDTRILCRILLPNILPVLIVQMTMNLGWAMLNGAGLSFLGLGIRPPTAEWGVLVGEGARYMISGQWWLATFPAIALCVTMLTLTLAGDRLRDHFDPRRR